MKLKLVLDGDTDLIPPAAWDQLKKGIHALGQTYGLSIEFPGEVATREAIETAWWEAVGKFQGG